MSSEARIRKFLGMNQIGPQTYQSVKALKDPNLRDEEALMRSQKGDKPVAASKKTDLEKMNAILGRGSVASSPVQSIPNKSVQMEEQFVEEPQFAKPDLSEDVQLSDFQGNAASEEEIAKIQAQILGERRLNKPDKDWRQTNDLFEELIDEFGMDREQLSKMSPEQVRRLSSSAWKTREMIKKNDGNGLFDNLKNTIKRGP